jgi:2-phospho-L-lactate transferase/gluconeogenesis factor (CofD/UPF0052 family)
VAHAYEDFLDVLVCDTRDARAADMLRENGLRVHCTQTIMRSSDDKAALAREVLGCVAQDVPSQKPAAAARVPSPDVQP